MLLLQVTAECNAFNKALQHSVRALTDESRMEEGGGKRGGSRGMEEVKEGGMEEEGGGEKGGGMEKEEGWEGGGRRGEKGGGKKEGEMGEEWREEVKEGRGGGWKDGGGRRGRWGEDNELHCVCMMTGCMHTCTIGVCMYVYLYFACYSLQ